jgi:hypothetical protein
MLPVTAIKIRVLQSGKFQVLAARLHDDGKITNDLQDSYVSLRSATLAAKILAARHKVKVENWI